MSSVVTFCGQLTPGVSAIAENSAMHCSSRQPFADWEFVPQSQPIEQKVPLAHKEVFSFMTSV